MFWGTGADLHMLFCKTIITLWVITVDELFRASHKRVILLVNSKVFFSYMWYFCLFWLSSYAYEILYNVKLCFRKNLGLDWIIFCKLMLVFMEKNLSLWTLPLLLWPVMCSTYMSHNVVPNDGYSILVFVNVVLLNGGFQKSSGLFLSLKQPNKIFWYQ